MKPGALSTVISMGPECFMAEVRMIRPSLRLSAFLELVTFRMFCVALLITSAWEER